MAKSSLKKEEHEKSWRGLSHSNREKEEREGDFWQKDLGTEKTFGTFLEERELDPKRNFELILGEGKSLKRHF